MCSQVFLQIDTLEEVVINGERADHTTYDRGQTDVATTEQTAERDPQLNLVCRGAYAQEVIYRGLSGAQVATLVDGMRIYGACTDKMDPVTSYVDRSNLSVLQSDQTASIGFHALNFKLEKGEFGVERRWKSGVFSSYQINNAQRRIGANAVYESKDFWWLASASHTEANNYVAGSGQKIRYTQFTKQNLYSASGWRRGKHEFTATGIVDRAYDIGYAGLPMDVSSATAVITKLEHKTSLGKWKNLNSVYFNDVAHVMDDTKRDSVFMHMDMPGWSTTLGYHGQLQRVWNQWILDVDFELVRNRRFAEMTMYPVNEVEMYMQTWSVSVREMTTLNPTLKYFPNDRWKFEIVPAIAYYNDQVKEEFGQKQFEVLGYDLTKGTTSLSKSLALTSEYNLNKWGSAFTFAAGDRAPELSERFGFYLYNNQDGFDYMGNPLLSNEQFARINWSNGLKFEKHRVTWSKYVYFFDNYIFGVHNQVLWQMTPGGNGVKEYQNVGSAFIAGSELEVSLFEQGLVPTQITVAYRYGEGENVGYLPQMMPLEVKLFNKAKWKGFDFGLTNVYSLRYTRASQAFGEQNVPAYWMMNAAVSRKLTLKKSSLDIEIAGSNLLDNYYTTHLNWNGIPQMGRNVSLSLKWNFGAIE